MTFFREEHIGRISFFASVILVVLLTGVLGTVLVRGKYQDYRQNLKRVESLYISLQKYRLKSAVTTEIRRIDGYRRSAENRLKEQLRQRVMEAHDIALAIHESREEGQMGRAGDDPYRSTHRLIRNTLGAMRFFDHRGYFFIWSDAQKHLVLYPPDPDAEENPDYIARHRQGQRLLPLLAQAYQAQGETFISYPWPRPNHAETTDHPKMTCVKPFKPLGWLIGTGEYLDSFEAGLKKTWVKDRNSDPTAGTSPEYVFIYQVHDINGGEQFATMLVNPNRPDLVGNTLSDSYADAKGIRFRRRMLEGIRENGESFVTYWYKKPGEQGLFAKLSYFKFYPDWQWIVAKGVYLDDLNTRIIEMQENLRRDIRSTMGFLVVFLLMNCLVFLGVAYLFSRGVNHIFQGYRNRQAEQRKRLEELNRTLRVQAVTDPLTGIYNRGYFNKRLEKELQRTRRYQRDLALVIFDIDHFKRINDSLGHLAGDAVLKELTALVTQNIRTSDVFARWGGEEFAVLLPENRPEQALFFARKIRAEIQGHLFSIGTRVTCSFGVASFAPDDDVDDLVNRADTALYEVKRSGRNAVKFIGETPQ